VGLWVFRVAGLRWTWAVFASLALTFLPYHWYRFPHIYLATMYSMVLGVGLALLVGNGTVERRLRSPGRWRFVAGLLLVAAVIGASGVYYACFTVLLCVTAILYRVLRGVRWRDAALSATPALAVTLALGAVLAPAMLYAWANPPLEPVAERDLAESVMYGGALVLALLPAPTSDIPGFGAVTDFSRDAVSSISGYPLSEVHSYSNFGCVATVAALLVFAVGGLVLARRSAVGAATGGGTFSTGREEPAVSLGLVSLLLATTLLFFVPWGLSYLFSYVVTTDLRGWNRLVPVLFTLLFVGAGLVLQRLGGRLRPVGAGIVAVVALLLLVFDSVLPYRGVFTGFTKEGRAFGDAGNAYAAALNEAVPGNCGVLQLPYVAYPEVPPRGNMGDYEQLWAALTNPGKSWSFGAMKGTEASAWQKSLGGYVEAEDIAPLKAAGFCAVHLDRRGYSAAEGDWTIARLSELLGPPVAAGLKNQWLAFALPSSGDTAVDADRLTQEPDGVGTFFAPPQWAPERGLASKPQETHPRTIWRLKSRTSELEATALPDGLPFSSISGELHAGECASNELTLTLRSGDDVQTRSIRLEAGEWTAFQMSLDEAHRNASFSVTRSGPRCEADADSGNGLSLVDLRAIG
jgi:phosphoglycerol transferase